MRNRLYIYLSIYPSILSSSPYFNTVRKPEAKQKEDQRKTKNVIIIYGITVSTFYDDIVGRSLTAKIAKINILIALL